MKEFIRNEKRTSAQKKVFKQPVNPFIKTVMYVFLFIIIPAILLGLCLNLFTFRKLFMQGILFIIFLLAKGYIFLGSLKLTNKWYLIFDAFFIAVFAGLYRFVEHSDKNFILLFFTVYITCIHSFFMVRDITQKGFTPLKEDALNYKLLFQKRIINLVDIAKPIDVYIRNRTQTSDNFSAGHEIDIELLTNRFFNSIDRNEFPVTSNEIIKIYKELNINIFKQRRYSISEFSSILISLDLVRSDTEYNSLKRQKCSPLKGYNLGGNLKKLLQVIAILKEIDCPSTCAKDLYDYWIATESSQT